MDEMMMNELTVNASGEKYSDVENRVLWLDSEITDDTLWIVNRLIQYSMEDQISGQRKPITIMIYCTGGDADVANSIIDAIGCSISPVTTVNLGKAYSAAVGIFLAGSVRYVTKNANFLIHKGCLECSGSYDEVVSCIEYQAEKMEDYIYYIASRTNITAGEIQEKMERGEFYFNAEYALIHGFATAILNNYKSIMRKGTNGKSDSLQ